MADFNSDAGGDVSLYQDFDSPLAADDGDFYNSDAGIDDPYDYDSYDWGWGEFDSEWAASDDEMLWGDEWDITFEDDWKDFGDDSWKDVDKYGGMDWNKKEDSFIKQYLSEELSSEEVAAVQAEANKDKDPEKSTLDKILGVLGSKGGMESLKGGLSAAFMAWQAEKSADRQAERDRLAHERDKELLAMKKGGGGGGGRGPSAGIIGKKTSQVGKFQKVE